MELNRRNFILSLLGGTAGIHLTPLPWKLMDDTAIWTQNWPWVPVPPVGEFTHEKSVCHLCPGGCGIEVRKVDDRAVKIEGRTDYPVNPGGLCPLGMGGLQLLYNESTRFTGPMKRVGPRGAGVYQDISWDEALDMVSGRLADLRKQNRPEALAAVDGRPGRSTMSLLIERFMHAFGSPNTVRMPCAEDTFLMAMRLMQGSESPMAYDLENSDYILSFGSGLLEGWGAPGRVLHAWGLWKDSGNDEKAKVVQIESRASNTASKSDQWIAVKPGTEAALALGMAHVIIKENLYNTSFVDYYSAGFSGSSLSGQNKKDFKTLVLEDYSISKVHQITGVPTGKIDELARAFAKAESPVAICGKGKGTLNGSLYEYMAVHALNALVGNINQPGGVLVHDAVPLSPLPELQPDTIAEKGLENPRLDQAGTQRYPFTKSLINNLAEAIIEAPESPVDTLFVFGANPAFTLPDGGHFRKALKKIPFIVSFSPFHDETAYMSDLILPDHTYLEKMEDVVWPTGLQYPLFGLSRPVVDPVYQTRHSGDVLLELAKKTDSAAEENFPWSSFEDVLKHRAQGLFEAGGSIRFDPSEPVWEQQKQGSGKKSKTESFKKMWKKLKSGGFWYQPDHTYKDWYQLFKTHSGKFEFMSSEIESAVVDYARQTSLKEALAGMGLTKKGHEILMPHYEEPEPEEDASEYPLLMVPYEMINLASGWVPNPPFLKKTLFDNQLLKDESFAEMHPQTAADHQLEEGDRVMVKSPAGKLQVRVHLFEGAMPGVVFLPLGLGHSALDEFSRGKGVNPTDVIKAGKDPLSGLPVWWKTPVKLSKV